MTGPAGPAGPAGGVDSVTCGVGCIADPITGDVVINTVSSPGYVPNGRTSGGGVEWVSGLDFTVGAAEYRIAGTAYSSALTSLTLDAADPTDPRIDMIVLTSSGTVDKVTGTAAPSPVAPVEDPNTQIALAFVNVAAGATTPTGITYTIIYDENVEWTASAVGGTCNVASASNPYRGTVDVECTTAIAGNYVQFVAPSPIDLAAFNNLTFYIRSKAAWANAKSLQLTWYNSTTQRGVIIPIRTGQFGFNSSTLGSYQQVQIPIGLFGLQGIPVDRIRLTVVGGGGSIGMYMDAFTLQSGMAPPPDPTAIPAMIWKGAWNATTAYAVNDVVSLSNRTYVAIVANTSTTPPNATLWSVVGYGNVTSAVTLTANLPVFGNGTTDAIVGTRTGNTTQVATSTGAQTSGRCVEIDASGNHIAAAAPCGTVTRRQITLIVNDPSTTGTKACSVQEIAGTIVAAHLISNALPTGADLVVDVLKVAFASYTGVGAASSITAAAIPIIDTTDTNPRYEDTTLTGWTTAIAANDVVCVAITTAPTGGATWASLTLEVTQ